MDDKQERESLFEKHRENIGKTTAKTNQYLMWYLRYLISAVFVLTCT